MLENCTSSDSTNKSYLGTLFCVLAVALGACLALLLNGIRLSYEQHQDIENRVQLNLDKAAEKYSARKSRITIPMTRAEEPYNGPERGSWNSVYGENEINLSPKTYWPHTS
jgi:hypothetical protein